MVNDTEAIVIIGAGLSGATLAERYASIGKRVVIFDKRSHIGGNCYDYLTKEGIRISKYGAHIFHTNDEEVWGYVNKFSKWNPYEHRVVAMVDGQLVPVPANIDTYRKVLKRDIDSEFLKDFLENKNAYRDIEVKNSEDSALKRLGSREIYEKMFKNYTKKQWDMFPEELDASVMERIPVRYDGNDRYFGDKYEAMPSDGYTLLFENMLSNPLIEVHTRTDFFDVKDQIGEYEKLFFTGPIDAYFEDKFEKLEYRSINFVNKLFKDTESFQPNAVVNYPSEDVGYTRIIEHKKLYGQVNPDTVVTYEYSTDKGDPYYPIPNQKNRDRYELYRKEAEKSKDVIFVGRLANYKYFNMDQAIKNALNMFKELEDVE